MIGAQINLNGLGNTFANRNLLIDEAITIGGCGLTMDDLYFAQTLQARGGKEAVIVHRHYLDLDNNGDGDEDELYKRIAPDAWLNIVQAEGANGVLLQYHNEPVITASTVDDFVANNVALIKAAHARKLHVAVGAFSVANPAEKLITSGAFDPMLLALDADDALLLHEYFIKRPTDESEHGFLCGRVEWWLERMVLLKCRCRTVVIGEYGRDLGGGQHDGWRDQKDEKGNPWTPEHYAALLLEGMDEIYLPLAKQYGFRILVDVFCAGSGYGRWTSYNVEGEQKIYQPLTRWNKEHPMTQNVNVPAPTSGGVDGKLSKLPGNFVNLRDQPYASAHDVGDLHLNDVVVYYPDAPSDGWIYVQPFNGTPGWVSLQAGAVAFTPTASTPAPAPQGMSLTAQQYADLQTASATITRVLSEVKPPASGGGF